MQGLTYDGNQIRSAEGERMRGAGLESGGNSFPAGCIDDEDAA